MIVPLVTTTSSIWALLILLLAVHLGTNYLAVCSVSMRSINRQRANILLSTIIDSSGEKILTPQQVSQRERIFERDGLLRWHTGESLGVYCRIGGTLGEMVGCLRRAATKGAAAATSATVNLDLSILFLDIFAKENYILYFDKDSSIIFIVLKTGADTIDQLKAWTQALLLARTFYNNDSNKVTMNDGHDLSEELEELKDTLQQSLLLLQKHDTLDKLRRAGYDLNAAALETSSRSRIHVRDQ